VTNAGYRSYVIRVRRRLAGGDGVRTTLDVEDLLGGARATVSGEPASALAQRLQRLVEKDAPRRPPAGDVEQRGGTR